MSLTWYVPHKVFCKIVTFKPLAYQGFNFFNAVCIKYCFMGKSYARGCRISPRLSYIREEEKVCAAAL